MFYHLMHFLFMVRGGIIFILILSGYIFSNANDNPLVGGRSAGLGGSSVSLKDFWSVFNNQAGIAEYKQPAAGISYQNRFLLKELSTKYAGIILPVQNGAFGLSISYYGFDLYNEKKAGFAYAHKFGKYFSAGVQIDYIGIKIGNEYGKKDLFTFEAGLQAQLTKEIRTGLHIFNPPHIKLSDQYNERLPAIIKFGLTYTFSKKIISVIEFEKSSDYNPVLKIGIEYAITDKVIFRTGVASNPFTNSFGAGFRFGNILFDISSAYHPNLGFTSQGSVVWEIKAKE